MVVKIKLQTRETMTTVAPKVAEAAELLGALMAPASFLAFVFAAWRLAADLGFAGQFAIDSGVFSHWMVWLAIGIVMQLAGVSFRTRTMPVPTWLKQNFR
jgi:hypothetical protein